MPTHTGKKKKHGSDLEHEFPTMCRFNLILRIKLNEYPKEKPGDRPHQQER